MPVNQPQTIGAVFAILMLFVASAWGQQWGADIPVYESRDAIFGTNQVSEEVSSFFKAGLEEDLEAPPSPDAAKTEKSATNFKQASTPSGTQPASSFGGSSLQYVDKDGYLIGAASGGMWQDAKPPTVPAAVPSIPPTPEIDKATGGETAADDLASSATAQPPASPESSFFDQPAAYPPAVEHSPILGNSPSDVARVSPGLSKLRLRVGFDALLWERGQPDDVIFATDDTGLDWSFGDFDLNEGTPRYFIQYMADDLTGYEFTFFDFNTFSSSLAASGSNVVPFFFQATPANIGDNWNLDYTSRLKNIEFNSWLRHNQIQRSGYGVRHINLDESFDVINGGAVDSGLFSRTDNDMWGLNRMWERRRPAFKRVDLVAGLDVGLYLNRTKINVDTLNVDDSSEGKNLAGSLGFNLGLEYIVADHVTLRLGYEGLALFGVALASTQSLEQEVLSGLDDPVLGSIYFGGFHIGAIATF